MWHKVPISSTAALHFEEILRHSLLHNKKCTINFTKRVILIKRIDWERLRLRTDCDYYRPQRSWAKVIFSQACVKNSVHSGGRVSASVHAGIPPRSRHPPEPPGSRPPQSRHPPGADTPRPDTPLGADPPEQTAPQSRSPRADSTQTGHPPTQAHPPRKQTPAYGLQAAGMHPTGMDSCFVKRIDYSMNIKLDQMMP